MQIGIIGLGLMGGSLAKSFKKKGSCCKITAYDKDFQVLKEALTQTVIDEIAPLPGTDTGFTGSFYHCDIIFICTPVHTVVPIIEKLQGHLKSECILTDIGSTKGEIIHEINRLNLEYRFIGGHPMTGSEKKGFEYSTDILLENAYYLLTPAQNADTNSITMLTDLLKSIGALVLTTDPDTHDFITAAISHVPHVIASGLVNTVKKHDNPDKLMHTLAAGGFRDITRVASSSPEIWQSICFSNKNHILSFLDSFMLELKSFQEKLVQNDHESVYGFYDQAKRYRDSFEFRTTGVIQPVFEFSISVEDRPGIIARIATILAGKNINIKNIGVVNNREGFEGVLRIEFYNQESMNNAYIVLKDMNYTIHLKEKYQ